MKKSKISELYKNCSAIITEKTQEIHRLILGYGNCESDIMIITEIPSAQEEELGIPFVGKSGKDLEDLINKLGVTIDDVYTTNFVKYRPYKISGSSGRIINRKPSKEEIEFFSPYIEQEIEIINPKIIITLGEAVLKGLMGDDKLSIKQEHGKVRKKTIGPNDYRVFPMLHQSALHNLNDKNKKKDVETLLTLIEHAKTEKKEEPPVVAHEIKPKKVIKPKKSKKEEIVTKKLSGKKTIIIYGGSGYADDPTLVAVDRVSHVLTELDVNIIRLDLHKNTYNINHFFEELKDANSVVIAETVEWIGISGRLQEFLDKCYFYGDKAYFRDVAMLSIVISKQGYERDANNHLIKCWEILGGIEGGNIVGHINKASSLETQSALLNTIDKKTEDFYRVINQNRKPLPTSIRNNKVIIEVPSASGQLGEEDELVDDNKEVNVIHRKESSQSPKTLITNYDEYIEKQQKDIEDISHLFKERLSNNSRLKKDWMTTLKEQYLGAKDELACTIQWHIENKQSKNFVMEINNNHIKVYYGEVQTFNLIMTLKGDLMEQIVEGKMTVQRAFMTGEIKAQGDFGLIYKIDSMFELYKEA